MIANNTSTAMHTPTTMATGNDDGDGEGAKVAAGEITAAEPGLSMLLERLPELIAFTSHCTSVVPFVDAPGTVLMLKFTILVAGSTLVMLIMLGGMLRNVAHC